MRRGVAFTLVCMLSALLAWVAGYDFDQRGEGVAVWAGLTLMWALAAEAAMGAR